MARMHEFFRLLKDQDGSDLHLVAGREPVMRAHGEVEAIAGFDAIDDASLRAMMREIVSEKQWNSFEEEQDLDFACRLQGVARFRGNYFVQQSGAGAVFRIIPEQIIPMEKLGLPEVVATLADLESGLVLVTGPTGSGKSTSLASVIDRINKTHARHIVTIEDPVEFTHTSAKSIITHREVGDDTSSFAGALRAALRQDADVVLVGEMRDRETISLAIEAASMGTLVFGTLHTSSAAKTIDRIVDAFPSDEQPQVRANMAETLQAVVSQLLCRKKAGGRVAAHEILIRSGGVPGVIREGNTAMLASIIGAGKSAGMQTMDDALMNLVQKDLVDGHEAYLKANDKKRFMQWSQPS